MKQVRRIISIVIALTMAFGVFAFTAQAKSKAASLSLNVEVSSFESGYAGLITVAVTVKNTSGKDVKNIVVTSCGSKGLCMFRPLDYNVVINNPGAKPAIKKNAMTACLRPGGTMKYVYCVLLGYQYAKNKVPEAIRIIMLEQHKHIGTKDFRPLSIKANYLESKGNLTFGDIKTMLDVKAYYNVKSATYESIAGGSSVTQNPAVRTRGNYDASSARSSSSGSASSADASSSASGAASTSSSSSYTIGSAKKTTSSSSSSSASSSGSSSSGSSSTKTTPNSTAGKDTVRTYILDTATKTYHSKNCGHWPTANKVSRETTATKLESDGYSLCKFCAG